MRNYLLFILLVIICIKLCVVYYEPMTDMVDKFDIIGMGYDESTAKKIIEDKTTICAIPDYSDGTSIGLLTELNAEEKQELLFKDYKLKIKSGEQFHKKLNNLEQQIFISFYGPEENKWKPIYDKWKEKRNHAIDSKLFENCNTIENTNLLSEDKLYDLIKEKIKTLKYLEKINQDNYVNDYLSNRGSEDPHLSIRKMQYRSIEEDSLHLYNSYINWIYYLVFISLLLLLYSQSKLNVIKNGFIYIVLLLLPIVIYPYIFKLFQFVFTYFRNESKDAFPKNAFMQD